MTKLAFVVTHPITANLLLRGQLRYLQKQGFAVTVIASPGPLLDKVAEREGVSTIGVEMSRSVRLSEGPRALAQLTSALRRLRPDIVNASTAKAGLLGMIAARSVSVPVRIYLVRGLRLEGVTGPFRTALGVAERIAAACATNVVCVSESLRHAYGRYTSQAITVIPSNGVDPARFASRRSSLAERRQIRQRHSIREDEIVIGFVGRLVADKGIGDLLEAFERAAGRCTNLRLLLVGGDLAGDALPPEVERRLRADARIVLTGPVDDTAPYYAAMDVLAFPSYREGMPNVPLEAGACEVPTVGYRSTGVIDAVVDGMTGCLVPRLDVSALTSALARYAEDVRLREAHGLAARERVERVFANEIVWKRWATFYDEALASRGMASKPVSPGPPLNTAGSSDISRGR